MPITIEYIPLIISAGFFVMTLLFFWGLVHYSRQRAKKRELTEKIRQGKEELSERDIEDLSLRTEDIVTKRTLNFLSSLGKHIIPEKSTEYSRMRLKFLKAGLRRGNFPYIFWGIKVSLAILFPLSFFLTRLTLLQVTSPPLTIVTVVILALLGLYLPDFWLRMRIDRRKQKISEGLPDALDLLVVCVEAGLGLDAAINRVTKEIELSNKVLSDELKILNLELRAGKLRRDALRNLATRTDLEDVSSLVTLLVQTDRFGTSVAQALRVYSDSFRTKRYQRAEEIAGSLPVKLTFPLILFIFPALIVTIMGPALIRVFQVLLQH